MRPILRIPVSLLIAILLVFWLLPKPPAKAFLYFHDNASFLSEQTPFLQLSSLQSDPWEQAIDETQRVLAASNVLEHLQHYQEIITELDGYLAQLEMARPALVLIDKLKQTDIPLLGNAWKLLIDGLDMATGGAGQALVAIDQGVRILLDYHAQLQSMSGLDDVIAAIHSFQQSPSQQTLQEMATVMQNHEATLNQLESLTSQIYDQVSAIHEALSLTRSGLAHANSLAPQLNDSLSEIKNMVDTIAEPVGQIYSLSSELLDQIHSDQATFQEIQQVVARAEHPSNATTNAFGKNNSLGQETSRQDTMDQWIGFVTDVWEGFLDENEESRFQQLSAMMKEKDSKILLIGGLGILLILVGFLVYWLVQPSSVQEQPITRELPPAIPLFIREGTSKSTPDNGAPPMRLRVLEGPHAGMVFPLDRNDIRVGRSEICDVQIPDVQISPLHVRLRYAHGAWFIQDQDSRTGTFVNGQRILAQRLNSGDEIRIGNVRLRFEPQKPATA